MQPYTIHPSAVSFNEIDQGAMTHLHGYGKRITEIADIIIPLHDLAVGKKSTIPE